MDLILQSKLTPDVFIKNEFPPCVRVDLPAPVSKQILIAAPAARESALRTGKSPKMALHCPVAHVRILLHLLRQAVQSLLFGLSRRAASAFVDGENVSIQLKLGGPLHAEPGRFLAGVVEALR